MTAATHLAIRHVFSVFRLLVLSLSVCLLTDVRLSVNSLFYVTQYLFI